MLQKKHRLSKNREITETLSKGRGFFNPLFNIKFFSDIDEKKFTVVVSTKVFKSAVKRNRIKRVVREQIKKNFSGFRPGRYAIMIKPQVARIEEATFLITLEQFLRKVGLLNKI